MTAAAKGKDSGDNVQGQQTLSRICGMCCIVGCGGDFRLKGEGIITMQQEKRYAWRIIPIRGSMCMERRHGNRAEDIEGAGKTQGHAVMAG